MLLCVPNVSILDTLLFNIDIYDLFFIMEYFGIAICEDKYTQHAAGKNIKEVRNSWDQASPLTFSWPSNNELKRNTSKFHVLLSRNGLIVVKIGDKVIQKCPYTKLLGATSYLNLSFNKKIKKLLLSWKF